MLHHFFTLVNKITTQRIGNIHTLVFEMGTSHEDGKPMTFTIVFERAENPLEWIRINYPDLLEIVEEVSAAETPTIEPYTYRQRISATPIEREHTSRATLSREVDTHILLEQLERLDRTNRNIGEDQDATVAPERADVPRVHPNLNSIL